MFRGVVKTTVAKALHLTSSRLPGRHGMRFAKPFLVVGYHRVVDQFQDHWSHGITSSQISRSMLEQHLDWIGRHYDFVSLDELCRHMNHREPFTRPVAAVTFDDGYRNVYDHAFPILRRKGIPAAVFVVSGLTGTSATLMHDRVFAFVSQLYNSSPRPAADLVTAFNSAQVTDKVLATALLRAREPFAAARALLERLSHSQLQALVHEGEQKYPMDEAVRERMSLLTWEMTAVMAKAGITIGSHTNSHVLLTLENPQTVQQELTASKQLLDQRLNEPATHFAYPDGKFDIDAARAVTQAGFRYAYTICTHRLAEFPLLTIPRRLLWEKSCVDDQGRFSPEIMDCQAKGFFDWFAPCRQPHHRSRSPRRPPSTAGVPAPVSTTNVRLKQS